MKIIHIFNENLSYPNPMQVVKILLPLPQLFPLDYYASDDLSLKIGNLVIVPFRNKELIGIVWEIAINDQIRKDIKLKYVKEKTEPEIILKEEILSLIQRTSEYYLASLGSVAKLVLPVNTASFRAIDTTEFFATRLCSPTKVRSAALGLNSDYLNFSKSSCTIKNSFIEQNNLSFSQESLKLFKLSTKQQEVLAEIKNINKPIVIKGVTGSGKTEIYFHLIAQILSEEKQCLIMLPEISLSTQIIKRFIDRFRFEPIIWNSSITKSKKQKAFTNILTGKATVIIGARSSLFLPYKNLGLIVVDEEHDSSYKQEDNILYNARDMAVLRGQLDNAKILLCSATPSIETIHNINENKYHLIELKERYNNAQLPIVKIIDMRDEKLQKNRWISTELFAAIEEKLKNNEQVLLFLNRRGYAPLLICKKCGFRISCKYCTSWLVVHKLKKKLECHHCGYVSQIPSICPDCKDPSALSPCGPGIERIEEEVQILFPGKKIAVISKDQTKKIAETEKILHQMEHGEIDILIGTQIITKGYHFPNLTLIGVIDADLGLHNVDLKSGEKTIQLLHQVGGRAGRENKPGYLFLQTYQPDNIIFDSLKDYAIEEFIKYELKNRESADMPPFSKMAGIILSSKNEEKLFSFAKEMVRFAPVNDKIKILGPARALMTKLAGKYRYRVLVIVNKKFPLQKYLTIWFEGLKVPSAIHIKIDIDPQNFS